MKAIPVPHGKLAHELCSLAADYIDSVAMWPLIERLASEDPPGSLTFELKLPERGIVPVRIAAHVLLPYKETDQ